MMKLPCHPNADPVAVALAAQGDREVLADGQEQVDLLRAEEMAIPAVRIQAAHLRAVSADQEGLAVSVRLPNH